MIVLKGNPDKTNLEINTPNELLEYAFEHKFVQRADWRGWTPNVLERAKAVLQHETIRPSPLSLLIRFDWLNPSRTAKQGAVEYWTTRGWSEPDAREHIRQLQTLKSPKAIEYWTSRGMSPSEAATRVSEVQTELSARRGKKRSVEYWVSQGLPLEDAVERSNTHKYSFSPRRIEYWVSKGLTLKEAREAVSAQQRSMSPRSLVYWISLGKTVEEARESVRELQQKSAAVAKTKWAAGEMDVTTRNTNLEYWVTKAGGDVVLATQLQRERQRTFSFKKCVDKYGMEIGIEVWKQRQSAWQETMRAKPPEEYARIAAARHVPGNGTRYGKVSQLLFWRVVESLPTQFAFDVYFAEYDNITKQKRDGGRNYEYVLNCGGRCYRPDFCIPALDFMVEFDERHHWTSSAQIESDVTRTELIAKHFPMFKTMRISETEYEDDPDGVVARIVDHISSLHNELQQSLQKYDELIDSVPQ